MTPPLPDLARPVVIARPSLLQRLKLSEPARLYGYTVLAAVLTGLALVGAITGEWSDALTGVAAALLGIPPTVEATRASVYSTNGMVTELQRARGTWQEAA